MANKRLIDLPETTTPTDDALLYIVNNAGSSPEDRKIDFLSVKQTLETTIKQNVRLDELAEPLDNQNLDASTSRHGLLPKLSGGTGDVLWGNGTWNALPPVVNLFSSALYIDRLVSPPALTTGIVTVTANRLYLAPLFMQDAFTPTALFFQVTTATAGNAQLALYSSNNNLRPYAPLYTTSNIATNTTGPKSAPINPGSNQHPAGIYWLGFECSATPVVTSIATMLPVLGRTSIFLSDAYTGGYIGITYPAFPTSPALSWVSSAMPMVCLQIL